MDLALCKQEKFNGVLVDFYRDENNDVFMTREQIGRALEYKNPNDSIRTIHRRNIGDSYFCVSDYFYS